MDDERAPLAVRPEVILDLLVDRRRLALALERDAQQSRGLVDDQECVIFENDVEIPDLRVRPARLRAAWSIHPDPDGVAWLKAGGGMGDVRFMAVEKDLPALKS